MLHAWGDTLEEAFEQCVMAMFGYMTDTETVEPVDTVEVEAEGHDMLSLLFHFLDEWLYKFSANEFFIPREVKVLYIDRMQFKIRSIGSSPRAPAPAHGGDRPDTAVLWRKSEAWARPLALLDTKGCGPSLGTANGRAPQEVRAMAGAGGRRRHGGPSSGQSAAPAPQRGFDTSLAGWVRRLGITNQASS
ncbi:protein archease isoform 2-T4 [Alca torda]